ncbi:polysialic acid transporter [Halieaceae bacterium IMCC14734]|uniref:Polysialic acid transporter n=2 Tax=Candidatus Litorirhabdus singularis TaxID=2518993 RepID=A0ABT3TE60_9GAMM|nr:polysialic acid transporter [Candidatus Litorirhabdus singularis]
MTSVQTFGVNDAYLPFIESLQTVQQRAYAQAAPSGQDDPLTDLTQPPAAATNILTDTEDSRLEQMADEKSGPLSLQDKQQDQVLHSDLEQFGYDIFGRVPSTYAPLAGIPVPLNYQIGPGDSIIVQLFGKRNVEYKLVVTRDGNILVPEYGPVQLAGLTFDEAEELITSGFESRVIGVKAVVTMGQLRTVQIRLAGDVMQPGVYIVSGLSTTIDALLATGGIRHTGSLRNIELIRNGKRIAKLDFYNLLLRGRMDQEVFLTHNDTIFVPPIGPIVYVGGEVQRPAIYELSGEQTVEQVIAMSGGLLPTASLTHSHIERIQSGGTRTLIDFSAKSGVAGEKAILNTKVYTGDLLRVLSLEDELSDVVLLSGHVKRPGGYQFRSGMRVSDIVTGADELQPGADLDFLLIKRENPRTLRTEAMYVDLVAALTTPGGKDDIRLQSRDQLIVFKLDQNREDELANIVRELDVQATDYRPARVVEARGAVRYNGRLPLQEGARLLNVMALAGGLKPGADMFYGVIARTRHPSRSIDAITFNIAAAITNPESPANLAIEPGDRLYFFDDKGSRSELLNDEIDLLRQQASYGADEQLVTIQGEVMHSGTYPLTRGMRASDLLCAAQGLTRKAYGLGAELSRVQRYTDDDNAIEHLNLDSGTLLGLCDLTRRMSTTEINPSDSDADLVHYTDDQLNPFLKPMDQLTFTEKSGWVERATVTLIGEVERPGVYAINRGESLCEVMQRAEGLTPQAYIFGAEFTRGSVREMQQETLDELHGQLDELMIELSLSQGFNKTEKAPSEWAGKQDYLKAISQLEKATANGRMVIDLERALTCSAKHNIALEDGDILTVPHTPDYVQVAGQVYVPTSHLYDEDRKISDYVDMSGGHTTLGRLKHTYVIQANGEVMNYKGSRNSSRMARKSVMPGAKIYVPLDVDRMNGTEKAQTWVDTLVRSAILAGIVL